MQRWKDGSDVTGFRRFYNSTCKIVLDLLEPGDLRLGQVVIKRVVIVERGVNNGSGDSEIRAPPQPLPYLMPIPPHAFFITNSTY